MSAAGLVNKTATKAAFLNDLDWVETEIQAEVTDAGKVVACLESEISAEEEENMVVEIAPCSGDHSLIWEQCK